MKAELGWNPDLKPTDIAISVKNGVVTLAGFVPRYIDKYEAEKAAKRVAGVLAVANDIEIRLPAIDERSDPEIARDAPEARLLAFTVGRAPPVAPVVGFESLSRCRDVSTRVKLLEP